MFCAMVSAVAALLGRLGFRWSITSNSPTEPGKSVACSTSAVLPPAMALTKVGEPPGGVVMGPLAGYCCPSTSRACRASFRTGKPRPVAYTMINSPGSAGLLAVTRLPFTLAQQNCDPKEVITTSDPEVAP